MDRQIRGDRLRGGDVDGSGVMRGKFTGGVHRRGRGRRSGNGEGRLVRDPEFGEGDDRN